MTLLHLQLFWVEKQSKLLELNDLPELTEHQSKELDQWCKSRRKILNFEVQQQPWVRVNREGQTSEISLLPNGQATERDIFSDQSHQGYWKIDEGYLFIVFELEDKFVEYRVIGNASNNIHSAVEYINGLPNSYMKLIQTKPII